MEFLTTKAARDALIKAAGHFGDARDAEMENNPKVAMALNAILLSIYSLVLRVPDDPADFESPCPDPTCDLIAGHTGPHEKVPF